MQLHQELLPTPGLFLLFFLCIYWAGLIVYCGALLTFTCRRADGTKYKPYWNADERTSGGTAGSQDKLQFVGWQYTRSCVCHRFLINNFAGRIFAPSRLIHANLCFITRSHINKCTYDDYHHLIWVRITIITDQLPCTVCLCVLAKRQNCLFLPKIGTSGDHSSWSSQRSRSNFKFKFSGIPSRCILQEDDTQKNSHTFRLWLGGGGRGGYISVHIWGEYQFTRRMWRGKQIYQEVLFPESTDHKKTRHRRLYSIKPLLLRKGLFWKPW